MTNTHMPKLTPTEQRIYAMLSDGQVHTHAELMTCLNDDMTELYTLKQHVSNMRPKLKKISRAIYSEKDVGYRLVRLLAMGE